MKKSKKAFKEPAAKLSRRSFMARSALAAGAISIIPRHVLGRGFIAPSDKINLGYIGLGKQVTGLVPYFLENAKNAQIVMGSDVWSTKRNWFKNHVEKTYAEKRQQQGYKAVKTTADYSDIVKNKDVDAVIIATPDHWHSIQAMDAMNAGKHVYCEKPMTLHIQEGIDMVETAQKTGRTVQVGSMQRSWENFRRACELVRNGYLGEIEKVLVNVGDPAVPFDLETEPTPKEVDWNAWCGPAPMLPYNNRLSPPQPETMFPDWRLFEETGGGILTDWGAHMFDIAQWGLGMDHTGPIRYIPPADQKAKRGMRMFYDNGVEMVHEDFGRGWGVRFIGSEGTLDISRGYLETTPANLLDSELKDSDIRLYNNRGNHYQDWLDAIKNDTDPICPAEIGHRSATIGNICNIAYDLGRPLNWDPVGQNFKGDAEANGKMYRKSRKF
jgi:predicted dehydrogenase